MDFGYWLLAREEQEQETDSSIIVLRVAAGIRASLLWALAPVLAKAQSSKSKSHSAQTDCIARIKSTRPCPSK